MGMYLLEMLPVQFLDSTFAYDISVMASSDGSATTNEVFQFTLNDSFTNVKLNVPEETNANYKDNIVTWEIGTLDPLTKDTPLVLNVHVEYPTALQEGTLVASAITNTFSNEQGEEMIEHYANFNFGPSSQSSLDLHIDVESLGDCQYKLKFIATNDTRDRLTSVAFNYTLDAEFEWVTLPNSSSTVTQWSVGSLNPNQQKLDTATIKYIGTTTGTKTIFALITASSNPSVTFTGTKTLSTTVQKSCILPCCEKCPTSENVDFIACEQSKDVTIYPEVLSDGREIKVKVTVNAACRRKRVVVGLELFERTGDTTVVRRALKVLTLEPVVDTDRCDKRECDCTTFFIPDPICPTQRFIIKAQAHYYTIGDSTCKCNCPSSLGIQE